MVLLPNASTHHLPYASGPWDLASAQMLLLANFLAVPTRSEGIQSCCDNNTKVFFKCVCMPSSSLPLAWVTIVGLASTSTCHSSFVSVQSDLACPEILSNFWVALLHTVMTWKNGQCFFESVLKLFPSSKVAYYRYAQQWLVLLSPQLTILHSASASGVSDLACVKRMLLNFWVDPAHGGDNIEVLWWFESVVHLFPTLLQAHHRHG